MQISTEKFKKTIAILDALVDPKSPIYALSGVRLEAREGILTATTTNIDATLTCHLPVDGDLDACVHSKTLLKTLKGLESQFVELNTREGVVTVSTVQMNTSLNTTPNDDLPAPIKAEWKLLDELDGKELVNALNYVIPAINRDITSPHLNHAHFERGKIVSTDGHRLHVAILESALEGINLTRKTADILLKISKTADKVVVATSSSGPDRLRFWSGAFTLTVNVEDEIAFPPYEQVIPKTHDFELNLRTKELQRALGQVLPLTEKGGNGIKITINGAMKLEARHVEKGEACVELMPTMNTHENEDIIFGINPYYLKDALNKNSKTVTFKVNGKLDPVRVEGDSGNFAIVMPMRV